MTEQPACARGETCTLCNAPAYQKVATEDIRDPVHSALDGEISVFALQPMHGMSAYLCQGCYDRIMMPYKASTHYVSFLERVGAEVMEAITERGASKSMVPLAEFEAQLGRQLIEFVTKGRMPRKDP